MLRQRVLQPYGSTGVMEVLSRAVLQRNPVFCCPVSDFSSLESLLHGVEVVRVGAGQAATWI